jgi:dihydrofolate synthase/folylpolyglutamate synthase
MANPQHLADWLALLERRHPVAIELGLDRIARVAARLALGRPAPRVITVAGTNGKGSCVAVLEALLQAGGRRVGCYTSPHLLAYNERIRIGGQAVADAALCAAFARIEAARGDIRLTYFETGTLAALLLMEAAALEVAVLEVGMGGRLDAVNVIDPDVAVITAIDLDHQAWLGPDRDRIGVEKAGIARPGVPAVCGDPDPPAAMLNYLDALGAPLLLLGSADFRLEPGAAGVDLTCRTREGARLDYGGLPEPRLPTASAACAVQALVTLDMAPEPQQVAAVFRQTGLAGRFQRLRYRDRELILDVAHNPAAAALLARRLGAEPTPRLHAVVGALADKDLQGLVAPLVSAVDRWYCCDLPAVPRAAPTARLAEVLYTVDGGNRVAGHFADPSAALAAAVGASRPGERILVFGSFHTVASVLALVADGAGPAAGEDR